MKTRLIPANDKLVIYDPALRKRVPMAGIMADPRAPFWRRLIKAGHMISPPVLPVAAPASVSAPTLLTENE